MAMKPTILEALIHRQEAKLKEYIQKSLDKVQKGKEPTKSFSLQRQDTLLRNPDVCDQDWFFCVPPYFNDALDIRLMEREQVKDKKVIRRYLAWSQGSLFGFSAGDVIHDAPLEENEPWDKCLQKVNISLQIISSSSADLVGEGHDVYRSPGIVECAVFTPDEARTKLVERGQIRMTQDEFVRVLIAGPNKEMSALLNTKKFTPDGQGLLF